MLWVLCRSVLVTVPVLLDLRSFSKLESLSLSLLSRRIEMCKHSIAGFVLILLALIVAFPAHAQDIRGTWVHSENNGNTLVIEKYGNGTFGIQFLFAANPSKKLVATQVTCLGQYGYDGRAVTSRWQPSCQSCGGGNCNQVPWNKVVGAGRCAVRWVNQNSFVDCAGQEFHRH